MFYPDKKTFLKKAREGNLVPVYKEILADLETPVSAFMKIEGDTYSYLLESVTGGEHIARYSFLGKSPRAVFRIKDNEITITENGRVKRITVSVDPLQELEKIMARYTFVELEGLPRFCGGAVGYLGYNMIRFFEPVPQDNPNDLNIPDAYFIITDTLLIFDHVNHSIKVVSNAFIEDSAEKAYEEAVKKIDGLIEDLKKPLKRTTIERRSQSQKMPPVKSRTKRPVFEANVRKIKEYIRAGDIIQAVPSQRLELMTSAYPIDIYRALRSINPSPYMYYLKFQELTIIGTSPEILVRYDEGHVEVRPIAGTRPRGITEENDNALETELLSDEKERAEHIMLVDLGRNDIGRVCTYGSITVPELMVIEKYSHVMHIVSDVVGILEKGKTPYDVLRSTFPAGTVTGAPKIRAMEIIDELEEVNRGIYAGTICYFSHSGNLDSCITIRTILLKDGKAYIQVGAGIVADSVPEREYEETMNKAQGMIKAIQLAEEFEKSDT